MRRALILTALLWATPAAAAELHVESALTWIALGAALPLLAVTATAFTKAAVLLGVLRAGFGNPGVLPLGVTTGLAAVLALLVMSATARTAWDAAAPVLQTTESDARWARAAEAAWPSLEDFLTTHTDKDTAAQLETLGTELRAPAPLVRVAAFTLSELKAAFQLGVLLLLPFLIVDLLVANTLVTVGFHLLPPALVALPFKLLLFVAADGWALFAQSFTASYA